MPTTQNIDSAAAEKGAQDIEHLSMVLAVAFAHECGFRPLPWMKRGFRRLLEEGFAYDMLLWCIDQTSHAPRPSWAYLTAVVSRARLNGRYSYLQVLSMPHRDKDKAYRDAHFFDNIPDDILDEAIKNFEP